MSLAHRYADVAKWQRHGLKIEVLQVSQPFTTHQIDGVFPGKLRDFVISQALALSSRKVATLAQQPSEDCHAAGFLILFGA